jgi:RNA polymerase sigma-70 factor (ECF subfamily)
VPRNLSNSLKMPKIAVPSKPAPAESDAALVSAAQAGKEDAFDALITRYQRRVIGLCFRHVGSYEEACDLAQDIFVQVFQHLAQFEGKSSFSTWLYRVSLNACYNRQRYYKAKGRNTVTSLDGLLEKREADADTSALMRGGDTGALIALERQETRDQVQSALGSLEEGQRKVVDLVDIEGLSYEETADILKVPVNTVRSRLSRARQTLKLKLGRLKKRLGEGKGS